MSEVFTPEDTVVLKEDSSIAGIVEQSWRDIDTGALGPAELIPHNGVQEEDVWRAYGEATLPKGLVVIHLCQPHHGAVLIKEKDLILKDRGLVTGDVVKKTASDAESGYVVKTDLDCVCRPIYTDLPFSSSQPWEHKAEENEVRVPAEELTFPDIEEGKYVIYRDWVGEVTFVWEEVTVRLANGFVVRVKKTEDLLVPGHELHTSRPRDYRVAKSLAKTLKDEGRRMNRQGPEVNVGPELFYPGQRLITTKANLRLGEWKIGSYTPSQAPNVVVVETRTVAVEVAWQSFNVYGSHTNTTPPPSTLDGHELEELIVYNKNNTSSMTKSSNELGSRRSQGVVVGDYVAFRDPADAAIKYSASSPRRNETGVFRRIPRGITEGFEMNTFLVKETKQRVRVQWQNGSTTDEESTKVVPYLNVDENDLWPGEICSLKAAETSRGGMVKLNRIGVVQSVNAKERMAKVRWFSGSQFSIFESNPAVMEPGSKLGVLSDDITEVSVYEVIAHSALTKRRGDLVLISPNEEVVAISQARALDTATIGGGGIHVEQLRRSGLDPQQVINDVQKAAHGADVRWFGEIIDLGLDGQLTVRLGALDQVEDIKVPVTRVFVVVGGDDEEFPDGQDEYDDGYSTTGDEGSNVSSEDRVIEETIIYEGGERLDNDDNEDAWMTDDDSVDEIAGETDSMEHDFDKAVNGATGTLHSANGAHEDRDTTDIKQDLSTDHQSNIPSRTDYDFSKFDDKPESFEILDEPPPNDHHHLSRTPSLSAALLRRIRKEHKILASSLPDGIWVRTWIDRLDILRILILGPRATPYEFTPFVLDVLFKDDFPTSPPQVFFHSWTNGIGRINPNLYEDGKVCLSILGTWPENERNEGWNKEKSSLLQVLVSLMGLVLVENPYYNEAGFESLVGTEDTIFASQMYSEKAYCMAKGFIEHALRWPVLSMQSIIHWLYTDPFGLNLLEMVVKESKEALVRGKESHEEHTDGPQQNGYKPHSSMRLSTGAEILLKRYLPGLEKRLADLECA